MGQSLSLYQNLSYTRDTLEGNDVYQETRDERIASGQTGYFRGGAGDLTDNLGISMDNIELGLGLAMKYDAGTFKLGALYSRGFSGELDYLREFTDLSAGGKRMGVKTAWIDSSRLGPSAEFLIGEKTIPDFPDWLDLGESYAALFPIMGSDDLPVAYTQEDGSTAYEFRPQATSHRGMVGLDFQLTDGDNLDTHLKFNGGLASNGTKGNRELSKIGSISVELREALSN